MDTKQKELVAIGASVAANCEPCLEYHIEKARKLKIDQSDISEAMKMGQLVRRGAAGKIDKQVSNFAGTESSPSSCKQTDDSCCACS